MRAYYVCQKNWQLIIIPETEQIMDVSDEVARDFVLPEDDSPAEKWVDFGNWSDGKDAYDGDPIEDSIASVEALIGGIVVAVRDDSDLSLTITGAHEFAQVLRDHDIALSGLPADLRGDVDALRRWAVRKGVRE